MMMTVMKGTQPGRVDRLGKLRTGFVLHQLQDSFSSCVCIFFRVNNISEYNRRISNKLMPKNLFNLIALNSQSPITFSFSLRQSKSGVARLGSRESVNYVITLNFESGKNYFLYFGAVQNCLL